MFPERSPHSLAFALTAPSAWWAQVQSPPTLCLLVESQPRPLLSLGFRAPLTGGSLWSEREKETERAVVLKQEAGAPKEVSWLSRDRLALSLPALLSLTYEWVRRQGAALETSFTEGKLKQEGGVGPLPHSPITGNPVEGVATS